MVKAIAATAQSMGGQTTERHERRRRETVRRTIALGAIATLVALVVAAHASAHPLGNFTTNRYTEVVASGNHLYVLSALDLAEIPTFQAKDDVARLGRDGYAESLAATIRKGLTLRADGAPRQLVELRHELAFPVGVAKLHTTRLEVVFDAGALSGSQAAIQLENSAFAGRLGWKEIVVRSDHGARIAQSSAPTASVTDRLHTYPKDLLRSPLDDTQATAGVTGGSGDGVAPSLGTAASESAAVHVSGRSEGGFASLIEKKHLSVGVIAITLLLALFWGAAHALTPGHGKAIIAAYLVGTRGRTRDAFALGGIVTVTHTIGVFALGLVTLGLSEFIVPEDLYPWLNLISAVLVVLVGVTVLRQRILTTLRPDAAVRDPDHDGHDHHHGHDHSHMTDEEHARAHLPAQDSGVKGLLAVGISGGLLPCPTALVVLLAAISLHRVAFGLVLILAFSFGLAAVISGIGLIAIGARTRFRRMSFEGPVVRALPAVSALLIFGVGVTLTIKALPGVI
jgi:nickel/cobalt exporter